jgi:hypothetical protein
MGFAAKAVHEQRKRSKMNVQGWVETEEGGTELVDKKLKLQKRQNYIE